MKSLLHNMMICLVVLLFNAQVTTGQWTKLQSTSKSDNFSVEFVNADTGFIAAGNVILKTTNTGVTWTTIPVSNSVRTLSFPTPKVGYAAGTNIYKTTSGGENWDSVYMPMGLIENQQVWSIEFTTTDTGYYGVGSDFEYICGGTGIISKWTVDGGRNWATCATVGLLDSLCNSRSISFANNKLGFMSTWLEASSAPFDLIHTTTNGGKDWRLAAGWSSTYYAQGLRVNSLLFNSAQLGWVGGSRIAGYERYPRIYHTTDSGDTWDTTKFVFPYTVNTIVFANDLVGFIGDTAGNIYSTTDGGDTWQNDNVPSNGNSINSITIAGGSVAFAVGNNGLILKRDLPTSIHEESTSSLVQPLFKVYPNPTTGSFKVSTPMNTLSVPHYVTVVNAIGEVVYQAYTTQAEQEIDLRSVAQGLYYVQVRSGTNVHVATVLVAL